MRTTLLVLCAAATIAGCAIGKPVPQPTTYIVEPPTDEHAPQAKESAPVRMGTVRVAPSFSGSALVYRLDDVRYAADPYHAFIAEPAAMLGSSITEWLARDGTSMGGTRPKEGAAIYVLDATVSELYGDFRPGQSPAAVMTMRFALIDSQSDVRPRTVLERTISHRVDLSQSSPDALVRGYGVALAAILQELDAELDKDAIARRTASTLDHRR
jgi:cholesterol transport system auxiliary component